MSEYLFLNELKPCPFCGTQESTDEFRKPQLRINARPEIVIDSDEVLHLHMIVCPICEARGPTYLKPNDAAKAWNNRND